MWAGKWRPGRPRQGYTILGPRSLVGPAPARTCFVWLSVAAHARAGSETEQRGGWKGERGFCVGGRTGDGQTDAGRWDGYEEALWALVDAKEVRMMRVCIWVGIKQSFFIFPQSSD